MLKTFIEKARFGKGDSDRHLVTLFGICLGSHGRHFLELGIREGVTTLPMLHAAMLLNATLTSVDVVNPRLHLDENLAHHWDFRKEEALQFLKGLPADVYFDVIWLDDWHAYPHVAEELALLDRHVSPSGVILLHDLMYGNSEPCYHCDLSMDEGQWANGGAYRAVAELNPQFWEFSTLPWCNGLTILRKKYSSKYRSR